MNKENLNLLKDQTDLNERFALDDLLTHLHELGADATALHFGINLAHIKHLSTVALDSSDLDSYSRQSQNLYQLNQAMVAKQDIGLVYFANRVSDTILANHSGHLCPLLLEASKSTP